MAGNHEKGLVKHFNAKRGFGFIERSGQKDLFVHIKDVVGAGPRELKEGDVVTYQLGPGDERGPRAVNVRLVLEGA